MAMDMAAGATCRDEIVEELLPFPVLQPVSVSRNKVQLS
jgi:hypothetical protein